MPKSDPALKWLLANDPEAAGTSQNAYLRDVGIIGATRAGEIAEHEVPLAEMDAEKPHCGCCTGSSRARAHVAK